jgi:hypothetical protein
MPNDDGEIAAIFARLKEEVRNRPAPEAARTSGMGAPRAPLPSRFRAEQTWAVTADRPFENPPTRTGAVRRYVAGPAKAVLRKLMRWYVEPVATHQRSFNRAILSTVDELADRTAADIERLERRLDELEQQLAGGDGDRRG